MFPKYFIVLLAIVVSTPPLKAQNSFYKEAPGYIEMIKYTCVENCNDRSIAKFKGDSLKNVGVFRDGEKMSLNIINQSDKKLYYTIIDLQPDNQINLVVPGIDEFPTEYIIQPKETLSLGADLVVSPPYGVDKLITIFSLEPIDIRAAFKKNHLTRGVGYKINSMPEMVQHLKWILEGNPSSVFKDCWFSISDLVIVPNEITSPANAAFRSRPDLLISSLFAKQLQSVLFNESCNESLKQPEKLYQEFPLISLIQPLQAGMTRGSKPIHLAEKKGFVLKGTAAALKGIKGIKVNEEDGQVKMLTEQQFFWEKDVQLKPGKNLFKVKVITTDGKENCEDVIVEYDPSKEVIKQEGENHLLLIGINEYKNWNKLSGATKDIAAIEEVLYAQYQFEKSNIHKLVNEQCTKEGIDSVFRELISNLTNADNLIVYYAGHGILDKQINEGYWIPIDARLKKPIDYVSNAEIKKYLEALKTKHTLLIADACFSGGFFKTTRGDQGFENKVEKLGSKWVFCSGREEEVADVMQGKENSPFAYYLLKFLTESKGQLAASELIQMVKKAVANNSNQTPIGGPMNFVGDEGGEFIFRRK
jgi:hypothetical protein